MDRDSAIESRQYDARRVRPALVTALVAAAALGLVACDLRDVIAGGDHVIVTGEVTALETAEGNPLVFHEGEYRPLREDETR